ncbi:MAG TPA: divergent polysaccharide deacetylase family protein [Pararhizobium sp.]|nr:divergent polysaccharide deacetylase family protein [Pararhizobium sp.]
MALLPDGVGEGNVTAMSGAAAGKASAGKATAPTAEAAAAKTDDSSPAAAVPQSGSSGAVVQRALTSNGLTVTKITPGERTSDGPALIRAGRQIGQDPRLAAQPDPELYRQTKYGKLPVRGPDGARPMDVYARPSSGGNGTRIAIVVGGLGLSQTGTMNAIEALPAGVTLAFAATGNSLERWMQAARRGGHEILLQVPMEPFGYPSTNPGPHTLTVGEGKAKELDDLHHAMGRITNYTGIMNYMGGRLLADADAIAPVLNDVRERGLLFLDDGSAAQSLTPKLAPSLKTPYAVADVRLDGNVEAGAILTKLNELEQIARRNGTAIGVASAFDVSVETIAAWASEAKSRGIEIVGVASLADDPERKD